MSTYAERAAYIAKLEAENRAAAARFEQYRANFDAQQRAIQLAVDLYIELVTAPLRALVEELRR